MSSSGEWIQNEYKKSVARRLFGELKDLKNYCSFGLETAGFCTWKLDIMYGPDKEKK